MVRDEGVQILHVFLNLLEDVYQALVLFLDALLWQVNKRISVIRCVCMMTNAWEKSLLLLCMWQENKQLASALQSLGSGHTHTHAYTHTHTHTLKVCCVYKILWPYVTVGYPT